MDRRAGNSRVGSEFDMCDECMFELFGVDPATLTNKWAKNPFLGVRRSFVKKVQACDPDGENGDEERDEDDDASSVGAEGNDNSENDVLLVELREAKLNLVREKIKWYRLQNEIAEMDLATRQSVARSRSSSISGTQSSPQK